MTRRTTTTIMLTAFACLPAVASAQARSPSIPPSGVAGRGATPQAAGRITGVIVNARTMQPLNGAAVAIGLAGDSAMIGGGFTRADGRFAIDGVRPGVYAVRVRVLGYAPLVKSDVRVTPAATIADLGSLSLTPVTTELSAVTVTADRSDVAVAPDRTSYSVKDMPSASGGSVVDVLRTVPSVEVDGDNKVSLRGNENVVVQINGRISPMRGEQLGNFLAQLPANMLAKVEVVANPSAKNDPEGMAGIVNIVLKENTDLGTSGGFTVGGGTTGQVNASGNLGYQRGPLTLFANYGFMRDRRTITGFSDRQGLVSGMVPFLEGYLGGSNKGLSHSLTATADYKLGEGSTLSSNLVVSDRAPTRTNDNLYQELDASRALTASYLRSKVMTGNELSLDYALSYKRAAVQAGDGLSGSLALSCVPNQAVLAQKGVMLMNRIGPTSSTLNVANADGSNEHALLPEFGFDYHASWSAAGRWIVFTSERNGLGQADIYRVRPDGTGLERLTDSPALDDQAVLSPDGSGGVEWRAIRLRPRFMPPIPPFATRR